MNFNQSLQYGKAAESVIAQWLISRGHAILPVYEKIIDEGKGPQLFAGGEQFIAPDLLTMRYGKVLWIEAKHKKAFSWYRNGRPKPCFVTGIDLKHYSDYLKIARKIGFPIWLLFLHEGGQAKDSPPSPAGLFGNDILKMAENESHRSDLWGNSGMVYWKREVDGGPLKLITTLEKMGTPNPQLAMQ